MKDTLDDIWQEEVHSTRLFPKGLGADRYELTGIARFCDWVLLSDRAPPLTHLVKQNGDAPPRHIFVSMRNPEASLGKIAGVLRGMAGFRRVTVILASEDWTFPVQIDRRRPFYSPALRRDVISILSAPVVNTIFVENLDTSGLPRVQPLPLGIIFDQPGSGRRLIDICRNRVPRPISECPPTAFCAHRIRQGEQWKRRARVSALASGPWSDFCSVPDGELDEDAFVDGLLEHSFVICVEGGGLDPSPKAWQALILGRIPIIRKSPCSEAYRGLPVMFVNDWTQKALSAKALRQAHAALAPTVTDPEMQAQVLKKLTLGYWKGRIFGMDGASETLSDASWSALSQA